MPVTRLTGRGESEARLETSMSRFGSTASSSSFPACDFKERGSTRIQRYPSSAVGPVVRFRGEENLRGRWPKAEAKNSPPASQSRYRPTNTILVADEAPSVVRARSQ